MRKAALKASTAMLFCPKYASDQPHAEQAREAADQDPGPDRRIRAREPARE